MKTGFSLVAMAVASLTLAVPVYAQQTSSAKVADSADWTVFVESNPKECWAVSQPKNSVNTKNGNPVAVRRGDILLFVSFGGGDGNGQVSFTGGYPFDPKSTVNLNIDGSSYELFVKEEWAWAAKGDDAKIIASMKKGSKAVLTARSARGTKTQDTFSLSGATAAVEDASKRCK